MVSYFLLALFVAILAYPFCSDPDESPCTSCDPSYYLLEGVCLKACPTGCTESSFSCVCSGAPSDVFDVKFYENTDIQVKTINDFTQSTNLTGVELIHRTDPSPTGKRGYYFAKDSSYNSTQEFFPGLSNTLIHWVKPSKDGRIITMADSAVHYKVDRSGGNWTLFTTKYTSTIDGTYQTGNLSIQGQASEWEKVTIMMEQADENTCTLKGLIDDSQKNTTTIKNCWLSFQFDSTPIEWVIGKSDADGFVGLLYRVLFRNSATDEPFTVPSYSYTGNHDTQCGGNAIDTWICGGGCKSGPSVQGVCMLDCPYSFYCNSHMESLPTDPVLEENFDQSPCSYTHFQSGSDASTCFPSTNPQKDDVVPLKGRGAYYNYDKFLKSKDQVYLYHTFSIKLWVYHISGNILKKGSELVIDNSGMKLDLKNIRGTYSSKSIANSIDSNTPTGTIRQLYLQLSPIDNRN